MKILIVDDDAADVKVMKRFLHSEGFNDLNVASSGSDGLRVAHEERPEVILLDTLLPDMDGFEVLKKIKESASSRVIMMTGSINALDAERARRHGADDYLVKTTNPDILIRAVKKWE